MNTPAHVVAGLWFLGRRSSVETAWPIAAGGLLPDAPMFVFYAVEKLRGVAEATIWSERYYAAEWQTAFDLVNSLPLIVVGILIARFTACPRTEAAFAAMGLHAITDLPLHHDDGHRHFFPLSGWRFESPISYWDPGRSGAWVTLAEIGLVAAGLVVLWRRFPQRSVRALLATIALCYLGYFGYVVVVWM